MTSIEDDIDFGPETYSALIRGDRKRLTFLADGAGHVPLSLKVPGDRSIQPDAPRAVIARAEAILAERLTAQTLHRLSLEDFVCILAALDRFFIAPDPEAAIAAEIAEWDGVLARHQLFVRRIETGEHQVIAMNGFVGVEWGFTDMRRRVNRLIEAGRI